MSIEPLIRVRVEPWRKEFKATGWRVFSDGFEQCTALAYGDRAEAVQSVVTQVRDGRAGARAYRAERDAIPAWAERLAAKWEKQAEGTGWANGAPWLKGCAAELREAARQWKAAP